RLHQLNQLVQAGRAAGERVFEILDEPAEPGIVAGADCRASVSDANLQARRLTQTPYKSAHIARILGDIRYEDVSFSYAKGLPTLRQVSFHAPPGATIALVGATGAGKSTVVNLLVRFYEFTRSKIYVDE